MTDSEKIREIEKRFNFSTRALAKYLRLKSPQTLYDIHKGKHGISKELAQIMAQRLEGVSLAWVLTGKEGYNLNKDHGDNLGSKDKTQSNENEGYLVPLFDDVSTYGSSNAGGDTAPVSNPTEYINVGSWFGKTKITSAIRHYGDSMVEYPNGCILAIKEIKDFDNVVPGRNYVIETNEIRVTKRIQSGIDDSQIMAYSTNTETYPDGKQIHEPFIIKKIKITKVSLVIGRIVKEHSSGEVITI